MEHEPSFEAWKAALRHVQPENCVARFVHCDGQVAGRLHSQSNRRHAPYQRRRTRTSDERWSAEHM